MIIRIISHICKLLFIVIPLEIVGLAILPFILLFVGKNEETLPKLFRWYDNHEAYTKQDIHDGIDGLAGDSIYRIRNKIYPYGDYNFFKHLWHRYHWLAIRNPLNYFQVVVLGKNKENYKLTCVKGSLLVGDLPGQKQGHRYIELMNKDGDLIWEHYYVKKLYGSRGLRLRIGYKIVPRNHQCQWVLTINPFKKIESE